MIRSMRRRGSISAAAIIAWSAAAWVGGMGAAPTLATDVVVLKSGTMMEGQVISLDTSELVLTIESGKSILDRANVRSIHFDTTIGELKSPTTPEEAPETKPGDADAPGKGDERVYSVRDKKEFALGDAVETGVLRVRLVGAAVKKVRVVDLLGNVNDSREAFLVLKFEIGNVGDGRTLVIAGDPVFGAPLIQVADQAGDQIKGKSFGVGMRVEGELQAGEKISRDSERDDLEVFQAPGQEAKALLVTVNLERFGEKGTVVWRVARDELE